MPKATFYRHQSPSLISLSSLAVCDYLAMIDAHLTQKEIREGAVIRYGGTLNDGASLRCEVAATLEDEEQ